jgi:3-hydroxyisobutyrate dehydrogenase-like beta-hydroxyacid dehydrogenase
VAEAIVGLLHPGEMGAAVGAQLRVRGLPVLWASAGRSEATSQRALEAGFEDVGTPDEVARRSTVILSICPPHAAVDTVRSVAGFSGLFVDANAIAPATVRTVADVVDGQCVDGGIIGAPPRRGRVTHLYLSGPNAESVAELFAGTNVVARVLSDDVGAASALKLAYAAWTKGTAALLLAIQDFAQREHVEDPLVAEWRESLPQLADEARRARRSADAKGWRWVGEMEEIAAAFAAQDLPDGFHRAAAELFRNVSDPSPRAWQPGVPS